MAKDLIPDTDAEFTIFYTTFVNAIAASPTIYGATAADVTALQAALTQWGVVYKAHQEAHTAALAATAAKDAFRDTTAVPGVRGAARKANGTAGMTNALRVAAGMPEHDEIRTSIDAPATAPLLRTELTGAHLTVELHVADVNTPKKTAKPAGAVGWELWMFVGATAPTAPSGYSYVGTFTRTPYLDVHPVADGGQSVWYLARWVNAKMERGPWSEVATVKVPV
jgi:hypothetical protein